MKTLHLLSFVIVTALFASLYLFSQSAGTQSQLRKAVKNSNAEPSLKFIAMGDYGWNNTVPMYVIAEQMDKIAAANNAQFVLGLGDNFYDPSGVTGLDDPAWNTHWRDIYQTKPYLSTLQWLGTIGNHDYEAPGLESEFKYNKSGWKIEDLFWSHTHQVGNSKLAIVHIDTSYPAYGPQGEDEYMKGWFQKFGYTSNEVVVDKARQILDTYKDYQWILTAGHHQIGGDCTPIMDTGVFLDLFLEYNVSAYLHGHAHSQAWRYRDDIAFICSGAGGSLAPVCNYAGIDYPQWGRGEIFGFALITVTEQLLETEFFYTRDMLRWESTIISGIPPKTSAKLFSQKYA